MKELTFAFSVELNSDEDFIKEGTKVQIVETGKQYEGFAAVLITDGWSYNGEPVKYVPFVEHFSLGSFKELQ